MRGRCRHSQQELETMASEAPHCGDCHTSAAAKDVLCANCKKPLCDACNFKHACSICNRVHCAQCRASHASMLAYECGNCYDIFCDTCATSAQHYDRSIVCKVDVLTCTDTPAGGVALGQPVRVKTEGRVSAPVRRIEFFGPPNKETGARRFYRLETSFGRHPLWQAAKKAIATEGRAEEYVCKHQLPPESVAALVASMPALSLSSASSASTSSAPASSASSASTSMSSASEVSASPAPTAPVTSPTTPLRLKVEPGTAAAPIPLGLPALEPDPSTFRDPRRDNPRVMAAAAGASAPAAELKESKAKKQRESLARNIANYLRSIAAIPADQLKVPDTKWKKVVYAVRMGIVDFGLLTLEQATSAVSSRVGQVDKETVKKVRTALQKLPR
jgi:hypothetical protein